MDKRLTYKDMSLIHKKQGICEYNNVLSKMLNNKVDNILSVIPARWHASTFTELIELMEKEPLLKIYIYIYDNDATSFLDELQNIIPQNSSYYLLHDVTKNEYSDLSSKFLIKKLCKLEDTNGHASRLIHFLKKRNNEKRRSSKSDLLRISNPETFSEPITITILQALVHSLELSISDINKLLKRINDTCNKKHIVLNQVWSKFNEDVLSLMMATLKWKKIDILKILISFCNNYVFDKEFIIKNETINDLRCYALDNHPFDPILAMKFLQYASNIEEKDTCKYLSLSYQFVNHWQLFLRILLYKEHYTVLKEVGILCDTIDYNEIDYNELTYNEIDYNELTYKGQIMLRSAWSKRFNRYSMEVIATLLNTLTWERDYYIFEYQRLQIKCNQALSQIANTMQTIELLFEQYSNMNYVYEAHIFSIFLNAASAENMHVLKFMFLKFSPIITKWIDKYDQRSTMYFNGKCLLSFPILDFCCRHISIKLSNIQDNKLLYHIKQVRNGYMDMDTFKHKLHKTPLPSCDRFKILSYLSSNYFQ